jgi:hypothetical protein
MPWAKLDESFPDHPKVASIGDKAFRLHVTAICYCARMLTDGEVPAHILQRIGATKRLTADLEAAGLWEPTSRGSWVIHDFLEYNPSREQVEADRTKRQAAGQAGGKASGQARAQRIVERTVAESLGTKTNPVPTRTVPVPSNEATAMGAVAPKARGIPPLTEVERTKLKERWEGSLPDWKEVLDLALSHESHKKYPTNQFGYANNWLRRECEGRGLKVTPAPRQIFKEEGIFAGLD